MLSAQRTSVMFGGGGFVDTVPAPITRVRLYDEATKSGSSGEHAPDTVEIDGARKRNGVTVPAGARWIWLRASDERPDLQGEVVDAETIRRFSEYVIAQAGWFDLNHWSRPQKFPEVMAKAGRSPEEFIIGAITDIRVSPDGTTYICGFLWPKGVNAHADTVWTWLQLAPEKVHASVGGPAISRERERLPNGQWITRLKLLMNHCAICNQGVHVDTEVRTAPFGEFTKALLDGVPDEPCDGDGCVACFVRGHEESSKSVMSAGGAGGINAMGAVPEDLEGAAKLAIPKPETTKQLTGLQEGPINCGHFRGGRLPDDRHALAHMQQCLGWSAQRARDTLTLARQPAGRTEAA